MIDTNSIDTEVGGLSGRNGIIYCNLQITQMCIKLYELLNNALMILHYIIGYALFFWV